jgi:hypothetical protein
MFLYQTYKHSKRPTDHFRQNSVRLQTPQKKERVRLTVSDDRLAYSGNVTTSTADITTFKILINSTLSTPDAAMMMMDIKHYYLGTPLPRFEYIKMLLSRLPKDIVKKYNLDASTPWPLMVGCTLKFEEACTD